MVIKISSKFELPRFCRTTGVVSLVKLGQPLADELDYADSISVDEIGGTWVTVVKNEESGNLISTVVILCSPDSVLDDIE
jgi:T-complex protein 1 subunit theta